MRVILGYSGGLDTSCAIVWLKEVKGATEVIAVLVDVGQNENLPELTARATQLGADKVITIDKRTQMTEQGIGAMLKAGAMYEGCYLLGTAIARPFIADALIEAALKYDAQYVCHGATGKGNDYLRFESRIHAVAPQLKIISPWREWQCTSRESALEYVHKKGVKLPPKPFTYSVDANLWHRSFEGGQLEDLSKPVPEELATQMTAIGGAKVALEFKNGLPIALNGQTMAFVDIITALNTTLEKTGFGWLDLLETRTNGIKSRGIYHTPAGTLLYTARKWLVSAHFSGPTLAWMDEQAKLYGKLLYEGQWDHPLLKMLDGAFTELFAGTTGLIEISIQGSQAVVLSRHATPNLFSNELGSFGHMDKWNNSWSEALVQLQQLKWNAKTFPVSQT